MAKDTNKQDKAAKAATTAKGNEAEHFEKKYDLAQFLPAGFSLDDFEKVGGLRPICPPEINAETPIVGYVFALLPMPKRKADNSDWDGLLVKLLSTAQAKTVEGEIVTIEAGRDVIIPVSGALKNNQDLISAAVDPFLVTPAIFEVVGQLDTGKESKMWMYEVQLAFKKQVKRTGAFALYHKPAEVSSQPRGQVVDRNGHEPGRLVG
jgi:hypothetical protein